MMLLEKHKCMQRNESKIEDRFKKKHTTTKELKKTTERGDIDEILLLQKKLHAYKPPAN